MQATGQFLKRYDGDLNKDRIIKAVNEIVKIIRDQKVRGDDKSHPRLKQINHGVGEYFQRQGHRLWQYDIPPGNESRLLYAKSSDGHVTLLDYSISHDVLDAWKAYKNQEVRSVLDSSKSAPRILSDLPSGWDDSPLEISRIGGTALISESAQFEDDWLRHLDATQVKTRNALLNGILVNPMHKVSFILGPAGSGKTVVLTELAYQLYESTGKTVELFVPQGVEEYFKSASEIVPGLGKKTTPSKSAILLDDPLTFDYFLQVLEKAQIRDLPLVVSIDPVQWAERDTIIQFVNYIRDNPNVEIHVLKVVYRQAENVGKPALEVLTAFLQKTARHTDSLRDSKVRKQIDPVTDLSTQNVTFAVPNGNYKIVEPNNFQELRETFIDELVQCAKFESIRTWPQLLISSPYHQMLPVSFPDAIEEMKKIWAMNVSTSKFNVHTRSIQQLELVRGTEYENVFILIEANHWDDLLTGVKNSTAKAWDELAAPLTFLTRAINRCTIFLLPEGILTSQWGGRTAVSQDERVISVIAKMIKEKWESNFPAGI